MKRILALVLAFVLLFTLSACGKEDVSSPDSSSQGSSEAVFVKPDNYATVLLVTINPQFRLYLDKDGKVLAVEAVNKDAQTFANTISFENKKVEAVVEDIVTKANEKGFVKENAQVKFEVSEKKSEEVNVTEILNTVTTAANQTATELELKIEVKTEDKTVTQSEDTSSAESSSNSQSEAASSETVSSHTHKFSKATCTKPKTCTCGETEGKALGHDYKDGVCTRCKAKDPNYVSYTALSKKGGSWKGMFWVENSDGIKNYYEVTFEIGEKMVSYGGGGTALDIMGSEEIVQEAIKNGEAFEFDGEWWALGFGGGGISILSISEKGKTVTITTDEGNVTFTRTGEKTLKVTSSSKDFICSQGIKVGTIFNFS